MGGPITIFSLTACGGNVKNVKVTDKESKIYTSNDINSAIEIIKKEFQKDWKGCTLKEIYYAGDDISKNHQGSYFHNLLHKNKR